MGRLYQVILVALLLLATQSGLYSWQEHCSLSVSALTPDGKRPPATIVVEEQSGRKLEAEQEFEDVKFCDLGSLPVTVTVGDRGCNQVVVKDVPVSWPNSFYLRVIYDVEPCYKERPITLSPACNILFRVQAENGSWIQNASVSFNDPLITNLTTDNFGRTLLLLRRGKQVRASVRATHFVTQLVDVGCSSSLFDQEQSIKLVKR
jgi:hypothetical protein